MNRNEFEKDKEIVAKQDFPARSTIKDVREGETCKVLKVEENTVTLQNLSLGVPDAKFTMTMLQAGTIF